MKTPAITASRLLSAPRWKQALILLGFNVLLVISLLYGFELILWLTDPRRSLPFNGRDAQGSYITWGHRVTVNRFGFRERDFAAPRPEGVCRIMLLGDSFTWGTGVAVEERYSSRVERELDVAFPDRTFEVLNFGQEGLPTITERDILRQFEGLVEPDLIVVAFYLDDTQPRGYTYRVELAQIYQTYSIDSMTQAMRNIGLHQTAGRFQTSLEEMLIKAGSVPTIEEGLQRTYSQDSPEWKDFVLALADIKAVSDRRGLPPPLFIVMGDTRNLTVQTNYDTPDDQVDIYRRWFHQAERAAISQGFRTFNYEPELAMHHYVTINPVDGHPAPEIHEVYAEKLFKVIASDVQNETLCP